MKRTGIVPDMPDAEYHSGPELSSTGAKTLAKCPADFDEKRRNRVEKPEYDFGHAVHALILGKGQEVVIIDADSWRTKEAREQRDAAHAAGKTPLLAKTYLEAKAVADAVLTDPHVGPWFTQGEGFNELSAFATDPDTGCPIRARADRLTETPDGVARILDIKTTGKDVHAWDLGGYYGTVASLGYHQAADMYERVFALNGINATYTLVFVTVDKPYRIKVAVLDAETKREGARLNALAMREFVTRTESGDWTCPEPHQITVSIFHRPDQEITDESAA